MRRPSLQQLDPTFVGDLDRSWSAVFAVAQWLHARGNEVRIPAPRVRPTVSKARRYSDGGDIFAGNYRIEVKHRRSLQFSTRDEYPYPDILLDPVKTFAKKHPPPYAYVIVNGDMTGCLRVLCNTKGQWFTRQVQARGRTRLEYFAPLHAATYEAFHEKQPEPSADSPCQDGASPPSLRQSCLASGNLPGSGSTAEDARHEHGS